MGTTGAPIIFACAQGKNRSRTAAEIYGGKAASVYALRESDLAQAEKVFVFEDHHAFFISKIYPQHFHKVVNLKIPDVYRYNDSELKRLLGEKMASFGIGKNNGGQG